jgi:hypothetical protein
MLLWNRVETAKLWEFVVVVGPTLLATATFVLGCWRLVDLAATDDFAQIEERIFWYVLCATGAFYIITVGIRRGFRQQSRRRMLFTIAGSYAGLIVAFAATYYLFCGLSDRAQALAISRQYNDWLTLNTPPKPVDLRAFKGVESLWTGADAFIPDTALDHLRPEDYLEAFKRAQEEGHQTIDLSFKPESRLWSFLDCLHFSIVTMTTTGYGDIYPNRWYSKIAADLQIVSGMTMLVFALGMLFGNWWWREPLEIQRERLVFGDIGFQEFFWHDPLGPLQSRDDVRAQRHATKAPTCPWCGSKYTVSFRRFPSPRRPHHYDPRDSAMFFIFILSVATYVVYSFLLPRYFSGLSPLGRLLVAPPVTAVVALAIQLPFYLLSTWVYRRFQAGSNSKYEDALDKYLNSWSCETCRNIFSDHVGGTVEPR